MNLRTISVLMLSAVAVAGCSHKEFDQQQAAATQRVQNLSITCVEGTDCGVKWGRALQWVTDHSAFKLRIANDSIITTEGPISDGVYSVDSAMTINKVPRGDGTSEILFKSGCGNVFGCVPTHEMLLANFADFVDPAGAATATSASTPRRSLGVHYLPLDANGIAALHMPGDHGLIVVTVDDGSPASRAGIQKADVIISFASKPMAKTPDLPAAVAAVPVGSTATVHIWRGGQELDLQVQL
ncbi:MAG: S1C family serine protease [Hypericibacter sp.]